MFLLLLYFVVKVSHLIVDIYSWDFVWIDGWMVRWTNHGDAACTVLAYLSTVRRKMDVSVFGRQSGCWSGVLNGDKRIC